MYKIFEARVEFDGTKLSRVTVLVEMSKGDVRAIFATDKPRAGYTFLMPDAVVSNELLQTVAGYGMETVDRDEIFPNWKRKHGVA